MKLTIEKHPALDGERWNLPDYEIENVRELYEASAYLLALAASEAGVTVEDMSESFLARVEAFLAAQAKPVLKLMH